MNTEVMKSVFDELDFYIVGIDSDGNVIYINEFIKKNSRFKTVDDVINYESENVDAFNKMRSSLMKDSNEDVTITFNNLNSKVVINFKRCYSDTYNNVFLIGYDITDRILLEEKLKTEKQKAEESDKLKSAFLANISHEIRTPMNSIIGFADLLLSMEDISKDKERDYLTTILDSSYYLSNIIDDIIDISKIESGQCPLNFELINVKSFLHPLYQKYEKKNKEENKGNVLMNYLTSSDDLYVKTDAERIKQIIENFLSNAVKFTKTGSIELKIEKKNRNALISVKDTGCGIEEEVSNKIYDLFIKGRTENTKLFRGIGLGLTLAKKLSILLGIKIYFESNKNGSTFYCEVPLAANA